MDIGDDDNQEEEDTVAYHRSPVFSKGEVDYLLELLEKHKNIILNRLGTQEANCAKDSTWIKITKAFNARGFKHKRTVETLRTKWNNMKRAVRNCSKNLIDISYGNVVDQESRILALLYERENMSLDSCLEAEIDEVDNSSVKMSDDGWRPPLDDKESENSEDENEKKMNRALNFSPGECKLLFECINKEKDIIFNKSGNNQIVHMKNKAWDKVTEEFNKKSEVRRPVKVLKTKFNNMRNKARRGDLKVLGKYFQTLDGDGNLPVKKIKSEPTPTTESVQIDYFDDMESNEDCDVVREERSAGEKGGGGSDPLASVLLGATPESLMPWNQPECKEVVKLKMELLNYQIENAKLEKQRILQATELEAKNNEARAILNSLKLRAARLKATAAEMKFPENHPSLLYTDTEERAREYMLQ